MKIRPATSEEVPAILDLWIRAGAKPSHTDDQRSLRQLIDHDPSALIVAVDDDNENGTVVGSVIAAWDGWRGSIYRLAVSPDYRREGLGRRLLEAGEIRLNQLGAMRSQAIVVETDKQATAFWRASGWMQQTARLRFVRG